MKRILVMMSLLIVGQSSVGLGQGLIQGLSSVLEEHPDLASAQAEYGATQERRDGKFRDSWLPNLDVSYSYGTQHYNPADGEASDETPHEFSARVEQLVTDFGESSSEIAADSYSVQQKKARLDVVRERLLIDGLDVFIQVQKARKLIEYSDQSVQNISKQTKMESMLVEKGRGYSSNVLQAKTQLAGARARQNQANADLDVAMSGVDAIYKEAASLLNFDEQLSVPASLLPESLEDAVEIALAENPSIQVGAFRSKTLAEKITYEKARNFYPNLSLVGEINRDNDLDGTLGTKRDDRFMLELSYPLNFGLSGLKHSNAARKDLRASEKTEESVLREVERSVRVAWRNKRTATENILLLENKVNIAEEFLRLAKEERKAGRRTLLEVLAAETTLVNSQSELAAAQAELLLSTYSLIYSMGRLDLGVIAGTVGYATVEKQKITKQEIVSADVPLKTMVEDSSVAGEEDKQGSSDLLVKNMPAKGKEHVEGKLPSEIVVHAKVSTMHDENHSLPQIPDSSVTEPVSLFNFTIGCKGYSSEIVSGHLDQLESLSKKILAVPTARVEIYGYTSSKKNSPANIKLSQQRADFVKEILRGYGVAETQMFAEGMGNQNSIASNDTTEGRRQNRRVEIVVYDNGGSASTVAIR